LANIRALYEYIIYQGILFFLKFFLTDSKESRAVSFIFEEYRYLLDFLDT